MIDSEAPVLSVRRQCELFGLNRSSFYYQAIPESALNPHLLRLIDEQYLRTPFYGWRKMTAYLRRLGYAINGKRVRRLMSAMGIQAIYPKEQPVQLAKVTSSILFSCATCRLRMSTKCGVQTSPMCRCCGA